MSTNNRCPHCGARVNPTQPDCPECHREVPPETLEAADRDPVVRAKKHKLYIPWGLFLLLGGYFALVTFYTHWEWVHSPEYKASRYLRIADQLMGTDEGRTIGKKELLEALENLLTAINHKPDNAWAQQRIEVVSRRLQERHVAIPHDLQVQLDSLSHRYRVLQDDKKSFMPIGARDIWDLDAPGLWAGATLRRGTLGGLVIFVLWLYKVLQDRKHAVSLELQRQTERREDQREIGKAKRRIR